MSEGGIPSEAVGPSSQETPNFTPKSKQLDTGYDRLEAGLEVARILPPPERVLSAYEQNKDRIFSIFGADRPNPTLLYRGMGAVQNTSKDSVTGGEEQEESLDLTLTEGLVPHVDSRWGVASTSFTTAWPYARYYASGFQQPDEPLAWEYGKGADWHDFYLRDTIKRTARYSALHPIATVAKYAPLIPSRAARAISKVRANRRTTERTEKPGDFGIVVAVGKEDVVPINVGKAVYEVRTGTRVTPDKFRSIAVPLDRLAEYEERAKQLGLAVPVLPIEAVDYHFSRFPVREVTKNLRLR